MILDKNELEKRIKELEASMNGPYFWDDKSKAQEVIKEIALLKDKVSGVEKYDRGNAIITIFSGAGGDDAEDFSKILLSMYFKFIEKMKWGITLLHENRNDHGGYRNITFLVTGKNVYGTLKNESGVHRLVRISPFSAKKLRHTSFSMVEVIPEFADVDREEIPEKDLKVEFAKSGGPGGQNVNKRETAVRLTHIPTGLTVHVDTERSQEQNRALALGILQGKLFKKREAERKAEEAGLYVSKTTDIEWGNQIRSYVFHPYKLVKDHRTGVEVRDVDKVLEGDIEDFINAEKNI